MAAALSMVRAPTSDYQTEPTEREVPMSVSTLARALHFRSRTNVKMMNRCETNLINDLREIDDAKSFKEFDCQSLYAYAVDWLQLTPSVAYNLIAIMRRSKDVPELVTAIQDGRINVSAARKITPVITADNKDAWLELASTSSVAKIEKAVATASPKHAVQESMRYVTGERLEFKLGVGEEFRDLLQELKDILAQKSQKPLTSEEAIIFAMKESIARHSPLAKAKRARLRSERKAAVRVTTPSKARKSSLSGSFIRTPLSAATKHAVILRDGHRCTEKLSGGSRCDQTRWLDIHHVTEVSKGGDNSIENLRTICKMHHRRLHEQSNEPFS